MKKSLITLIVIAISYFASAQQIHCNMVEMPLDQMLNRSTNIVECIVLNTESYWDSKRQMIYTRSEVQVLQNFKGDDSYEFIQIITEGGDVDNYSMNFSDKINMRENLHLILFLEPTPRHWFDITGYGLSPVASLQSVFYVEDDGSMFDTFKRFKSIDQFKLLFGESPDNTSNPEPTPSPNALINVTSFSPTTITAGTKSILTINGSGFGNVRGAGRVKFSTALTNLRESALDGDYVSWTDTQIQVFVPSRTLENISNSNQSAATGKIEVINNSGESFLSTTNLNIPFSILNNFAPGNTTSPSIINIGSNSAANGFDFSFSSNITSFAGVPAIKRAMETWMCTTQANWGFTNVVSNATNTGADNVNLIVLDSSNPLPANVIARGVNLVTNNCFGNGFTPVSLEVDMIISANAAGFAYNFSTGNPSNQQIDLETVILHEFGHLLTLSHVNPTASSNHVMRASGALGFVLRSPHPNDLAGAEFALDRAETFSFCGATGMQRLSNEAPSISISSPDNLEDCLFNLSPITATIANAWPTDQIRWYRNGVLLGQTGNVLSNLPFSNTNLIVAEVVRCGISYFSNEIYLETYSSLPSFALVPICIANSGSGVFSQTVTHPGFGGSVQFNAPAGISITSITSTTYLISYSNSFSGGDISWFVPTQCGDRVFRVTTIDRSPLTMSGSISGTSTGVRGLTKTYSVTPVAGATHYVWSTPYMSSIVGSSTGSSVQVVFNSSYCSGNITCKAANADGCFSNVLTKAVNGIPLQPSNITFSGVTWPFDMVGNASVSNLNTVSNYQWSVSSGTTILSGQGTNNVQLYLTNASNNGLVCVTPSNQCGTGPARCKIINIYNFKEDELAGDISTESELNFEYYPNPSHNELFISFEETDFNKVVFIELLSIDGKLLEQKEVIVDSGFVYTLNVSKYAAGNYMLRARSGEKDRVVQIVID